MGLSERLGEGIVRIGTYVALGTVRHRGDQETAVESVGDRVCRQRLREHGGGLQKTARLRHSGVRTTRSSCKSCFCASLRRPAQVKGGRRTDGPWEESRACEAHMYTQCYAKAVKRNG